MVDFLIIGSFNNIHYNNVFVLFKEERISTGYNIIKSFINNSGKNYYGLWYSSFETEKDYMELREYDPDRYRKYENFNAINIDRVVDIPDYDGVMGVPVNFIIKWNKNQFKIVGHSNDQKCEYYSPPNKEEKNRLEKKYSNFRVMSPYFFIDGELVNTFTRILIKKKGI